MVKKTAPTGNRTKGKQKMPKPKKGSGQNPCGVPVVTQLGLKGDQPRAPSNAMVDFLEELQGPEAEEPDANPHKYSPSPSPFPQSSLHQPNQSSSSYRQPESDFSWL